jgi:exodeoxyribonuclease VII small subunit
MSDQPSGATEDLSFGDALAELDEVVAALESGQLELEDSLVRYERGVALVRTLQNKLNDAQQKVTMLIGELESESGDVGAVPAADGVAGASEETEIPF